MPWNLKKMVMNGLIISQKNYKQMQIIEEIKTNKLVSNPTEIQKICLDKLKLNPLPNIKSEIWRLSNKSKFSSFLDFSHKKKESKVKIPYKNASQKIIRLIIGENNSINSVSYTHLTLPTKRIV